MSSASSTASSKAAPIQLEAVSPPLPARAWGAVLICSLITTLALLLLPLTSPSVAPATSWMRLVDTRDDDQAYVGAKVLAGDLEQADFVLLGTSSAREAFWPEAALQAALEQGGGTSSRIVNLASSAQSPIEMLFLATMRPTKPGQLYIVLINLSALQIANPFENLERGGFFLPPEHLVDAYPRAGVYPEHWKSWSSRLLARWHALRQRLQRQIKYCLRSWIGQTVYGLSAQSYRPYRYLDRPAPDGSHRARLLQTAKADFEKHFESNLAYLARTLDPLAVTRQQRGSRLIVMHPPNADHVFAGAYPREYARFMAVIRALESRQGVAVVELNQQIDWTAEDFIDYAHVSATGRDKWSAAFVDWLQRQQR